MRNIFTVIIFLMIAFATTAQVALLNFASGLGGITDIKHAGDERLFVVQQPGRIKILDLSGTVNPVNFLDITNKVSSGGERGLLGLAFSPGYSNDGYFYVNYTNTSGNTVISRFSVTQSNPNKADSLSEMILLTVNQPFSNHNGGHIAFGPDGYLYIGMGDGGSGGDPQNNGQNPAALLGKMLRIDVSGGGAYTVPADNPFVNTPGYEPEIWALGVRNPWRFSFDRITGDMWIADVGQGQWEEINFQPSSSGGGENWGWRCYEGNDPYNLTGCLGMANYDFPVHVYPHSGSNSGCSVTGGYVYRGAEYPSLFGRYFYADYCSGLLGSVNFDNNCNGNFTNTYYGNIANINPTTFGEDMYGNLYIGGSSGTIKLIADTTNCSPVAFLTCEDTITVCDPTYTLSTPAGQNFLYQWYHDGNLIANADTALYTATQNGLYNVVVYNSQFCSNQSFWVYLNFVSPPIVSFTGLDTSYCVNDNSVTLMGTPAGGTFSGNGINGINFDPSLAGSGLHTITYTYTDVATGCTENSLMATLVYGVTQPVITQNADTLFTNVTGTIQWLDSTLSVITGANGNYFIPQQNGNYYVQYTDTNGCNVLSDPFLFLGISTSELKNNLFINISPNPAYDFVVISINSISNTINLTMADQLGRIVMQKKLENNRENHLDLSGLSNGIYYLNISAENNSVNKKLILMNH